MKNQKKNGKKYSTYFEHQIYKLSHRRIKKMKDENALMRNYVKELLQMKSE